jgi:hypothetical protein
VLALAAVVLIAAAVLRGAEYDEQYSMFLTAGTPRPDWPETVFPAGAVAALQHGRATMSGIALDLRATDVHPPLYFWVLSFWRDAFGPTLLAARTLSVLCGVISLSLVGNIARRYGIEPNASMLLTLGCYGFVYTNAIVRGFAPALMLTLFGVALLLGRRPLLAGLSLGAACCCNYLAAFVATAVIVTFGAWVAAITAAPFLTLDAWFFFAQHNARHGQFPPFRFEASLLRLAEYQTAAVFGGLPLYFDGIWRTALVSIVCLLAIALGLFVVRARPWRSASPIRTLVAAAVATPVGLLLLGAAFDNTPIELRYLSFGLPFIALLIAWSKDATTGARSRLGTRTLLAFTFATQTASILGLLLSARTMQPARATAVDAARLVGDGIVLLPRGNDGVGIVGAFGIEAPGSLPILLLRPNDPIADRIAGYHRVVVAMLAQDRDSIATIASLHAALGNPTWHRVAIGSNLEVYEKTDNRE